MSIPQEFTNTEPPNRAQVIEFEIADAQRRARIQTGNAREQARIEQEHRAWPSDFVELKESIEQQEMSRAYVWDQFGKKLRAMDSLDDIRCLENMLKKFSPRRAIELAVRKMAEKIKFPIDIGTVFAIDELGLRIGNFEDGDLAMVTLAILGFPFKQPKKTRARQRKIIRKIRPRAGIAAVRLLDQHDEELDHNADRGDGYRMSITRFCKTHKEAFLANEDLWPAVVAALKADKDNSLYLDTVRRNIAQAALTSRRSFHLVP